MGDSEDVARLLDHVKAKDIEMRAVPGGWPGNVELSLIDAVLSIRARYGVSADTGVRGAIQRYKHDMGGTSWDDLRRLAQVDPTRLERVLNNPLPPEAVDALTERTEGWAAGLHMAALSLRGRDRQDAIHFVDAFTGSHHFILDYLMEEVLMQQDPDVQNFLLRTAILNRLSVPLCDALVQAAPSEKTEPGADSAASTTRSVSEILHELEHANLFLVALDDQRRWYRYHHLFADLLRQRLHQADRRARSWPTASDARPSV